MWREHGYTRPTANHKQTSKTSRRCPRQYASTPAAAAPDNMHPLPAPPHSAIRSPPPLSLLCAVGNVARHDLFSVIYSLHDMSPSSSLCLRVPTPVSIHRRRRRRRSARDMHAPSVDPGRLIPAGHLLEPGRPAVQKFHAALPRLDCKTSHLLCTCTWSDTGAIVALPAVHSKRPLQLIVPERRTISR